MKYLLEIHILSICTRILSNKVWTFSCYNTDSAIKPQTSILLNIYSKTNISLTFTMKCNIMLDFMPDSTVDLCRQVFCEIHAICQETYRFSTDTDPRQRTFCRISALSAAICWYLLLSAPKTNILLNFTMNYNIV